jgi:hypothetical protein
MARPNRRWLRVLVLAGLLTALISCGAIPVNSYTGASICRSVIPIRR